MSKITAFSNVERKALVKLIETENINTKIVTKKDSKGQIYDRFFDDFDGSTAPIAEGIGWIKKTLGKKSIKEISGFTVIINIFFFLIFTYNIKNI